MNSRLSNSPVLGSHTRRGTWVEAQRSGTSWSRRSWRRCPWDVGEIEELQKVRLRGVAGSQMRRRTDEAILDKLDHRSVIHGCVGHIVPPSKRRDDRVQDSKAKLRCETLRCGRVTRMSSRIT